ncbi:hypothetical protein BH11MYX1_BH11MYX1_33070 [soil metagenome]
MKPETAQCLEIHPGPQGQATGDPCCQALVFYPDGAMSKYSGLEGFPGTYELDGQVARGTVFGNDFTFDFSTGVADEAPLIAGTWLQNSNNLYEVACVE